MVFRSPEIVETTAAGTDGHTTDAAMSGIDRASWLLVPEGDRAILNVTRNFGSLTHQWRVDRGLSTDPFHLCAKLGEEFGEVCRALVGDYENREGRGDLVQEAAQTVIVLASLVHEAKGANLLDAVVAEMERLGAVDARWETQR